MKTGNLIETVFSFKSEFGEGSVPQIAGGSGGAGGCGGSGGCGGGGGCSGGSGGSGGNAISTHPDNEQSK